MEPFDKEITNFKVYLFNCDKTYKLEKVEALLRAVEEKSNFKFSVTQQYFPLPQMTEIATQVGAYQMDFAVFVVHANESRLSINEAKAGIGYAIMYRALLNATGGRVLIVIGGDDYYNGEENSQVLSRWARMKIYSQFLPEYLDGRKSFIFSWDTQHRIIHEDALVHFLSKTNEGLVFQPVTRIEPTLQKEAENTEVEFDVDTQNGLKHKDAPQNTNEGHIFQPATRTEPVILKEAKTIEVEPKGTFPIVARSSKVSTFETAFKERQVENEKTYLLQENRERISPMPHRRVLIVCYQLQNADNQTQVVMKCFSEVSKNLGFKAEFSFCLDPEILKPKTKDQQEYIILLIERNVFERKKNYVNSLLALADGRSALRSIIVISNDHEWEIGQHASRSMEQSFTQTGSTIVLSWNENHPRFTIDVHSKFLWRKLQETRIQTQTTVERLYSSQQHMDLSLCPCGCTIF